MKDRPRKSGIVLYLRVSTDDRQHPEASFEYQRQRIQSCIERSGLKLPILGEYTDILSGKDTRRPGFQQMLNDARAGLFSHLGAYSVDRIGRNTQDTLNIIEELSDLGIDILVADSPNLIVDTPDGNLFLRIRVAIAQYEVELMSQRVADTKRSILLAGGWPSMLPDGYRRKSRAVGKKDRHLEIELDPERAQMWRTAWDLLLTDDYTLQAICQELHNRGYTRKSGKPWVREDERTGINDGAISHLSRSFHSPFYAGWVTSAKFNIRRGEVRGRWQPIVSDEEFDRGLEILARHDANKVRQKRHLYRLSGLLYMRVEK